MKNVRQALTAVGIFLTLVLALLTVIAYNTAPSIAIRQTEFLKLDGRRTPSTLLVWNVVLANHSVLDTGTLDSLKSKAEKDTDQAAFNKAFPSLKGGKVTPRNVIAQQPVVNSQTAR